MKVTIDKFFTSAGEMPMVKQMAKDFKGAYTDGDLLRSFIDQSGLENALGHEVLSATVEAFPVRGGEVNYFVSLCTHGFRAFCEIEFFCDQYLNVNVGDSVACPGEKMYTQRIYTTA